MRPLRSHVAITVDGGGIKGVIVTRALAILEEHLGQPLHEICQLTAGTSTGSIIAVGLARQMTGAQMHALYVQLGATIFPRSLRTAFWPLSRFRYSHEPLAAALTQHLGSGTMGDLWTGGRRFDVVITAFDVETNRTCFIKPWKEEYATWPIVKAVLASCSVPTFFPPVEGRYVDGGVGSFANPCYLGAYELCNCLGWDATETTLISLGTGRDPHQHEPGEASRYWAWDWIEPTLGAFLHSADDQQVHLVDTFYKELDFRRFQVDLQESIRMDDASQIPLLNAYGDELGRKILSDELDRAQCITPGRAPRAVITRKLEPER